MKHLIALIFMSYSLNIFSQNDAGAFSLGMRNTISMFDHDREAKVGYGVGGQFRLQVLERLNTEWFFDYIQQDLGEIALRKDYHIGWSLMFYPWLHKDKEKLQLFKPYIIAGHCFDWSNLTIKDYRNVSGNNFSSAIQIGAGFHVFLSERFDLTLITQYMMHLGKDIQIQKDLVNHVHNIKELDHVDAFGHLLINLSINYKIINLWKLKK